jgi:GrpB-like predicted nucleotidyltransferase (UPF0157 family)
MYEDDKRLVISDYQSRWIVQFQDVATDLRSALGDVILRIDHIGSTSVAGLAAKDIIDVQVTVRELAEADAWPDELLPGLIRRPGFADHVPAGGHPDPLEWTKRYWSRPHKVHVHVREHGRLNQRYALLFRDYLRSEPRAAAAYADLKRALAAAIPNDRDTYSVVKDPACDLIMLGAEQWAAHNEWSPAASDA